MASDNRHCFPVGFKNLFEKFNPRRVPNPRQLQIHIKGKNRQFTYSNQSYKNYIQEKLWGTSKIYSILLLSQFIVLGHVDCFAYIFRRVVSVKSGLFFENGVGL